MSFLRSTGLAWAFDLPVAVSELLAELGIVRVPCPIPFPQAGGPVNVYAIEEEGGGWALFDAGLGTEECERTVREGLAGHGIHFRDVRRIYLSHGHIDHYGLARTISEESGAPVFIHAADRLKVERPALEFERSREAARQYFACLGVDRERMAWIERGHEFALAMARPIEHTRPVEEGETLRFARFSAQVMHAPGHTPGLTCLYVPSRRLLFSDDHLLERVSPNPLIDVDTLEGGKSFRALSSYLRTLERTAAMEIDLVLPGHNEPFTGPRAIIDRLYGFYERRQQKILTALADGPMTAVELVELVFPHLKGRELYLTLSEVVGNVEVLEDKGLIRRRPADPVYSWELAR